MKKLIILCLILAGTGAFASVRSDYETALQAYMLNESPANLTVLQSATSAYISLGTARLINPAVSAMDRLIAFNGVLDVIDEPWVSTADLPALEGQFYTNVVLMAIDYPEPELPGADANINAAAIYAHIHLNAASYPEAHTYFVTDRNTRLIQMVVNDSLPAKERLIAFHACVVYQDDGAFTPLQLFRAAANFTMEDHPFYDRGSRIANMPDGTTQIFTWLKQNQDLDPVKYEACKAYHLARLENDRSLDYLVYFSEMEFIAGSPAWIYQKQVAAALGANDLPAAKAAFGAFYAAEPKDHRQIARLIRQAFSQGR